MQKRLDQLEARVSGMRLGTPGNPSFETYMLDRATNQVYRVFVNNGTLVAEKAR